MTSVLMFVKFVTIGIYVRTLVVVLAISVLVVLVLEMEVARNLAMTALSLDMLSARVAMDSCREGGYRLGGVE